MIEYNTYILCGLLQSLLIPGNFLMLMKCCDENIRYGSCFFFQPQQCINKLTFCCLFVCMFVWSFLSHSRIVHSFGDVTFLPVKVCKFWPMLGTYGHWALRVFQLATLAVTRGIHLKWSSPRTLFIFFLFQTVKYVCNYHSLCRKNIDYGLQDWLINLLHNVRRHEIYFISKETPLRVMGYRSRALLGICGLWTRRVLLMCFRCCNTWSGFCARGLIRKTTAFSRLVGQQRVKELILTRIPLRLL